MNHPKREEWVPYLYGEVKPDARRALQAHLKDCPACRVEIEGWKRSVKRLDAWKLPRTKTPLDLFAPALKWAAAAVVMLAAGFALGRFTGGEMSAERVRARMEPELRQALRHDMEQLVRQEVDRTSSAVMVAAANQTEKLLAAYNTINETRRTEDLEGLYLAIKKQLDTVAINTQQEFTQLAGDQLQEPGSSKE